MRIRPYVSVALLALAFGAIVLAPSSSPGQVQLETQRKIVSKVDPVVSRARQQNANQWNRQGGGRSCAQRKTEVDSSDRWPSAVGKSRGRCHRKMEMVTGSAGNQRTRHTQFSSPAARRLKCSPRTPRQPAAKSHPSHARRLPQPTLQIRRQQLMKQLFSRFAPHREPPGSIGPRFQSPLHRLANSQILILHTIPHRDTLLVVSARRLAHVAEVEIKNHPAMVHINRESPDSYPDTPRSS